MIRRWSSLVLILMVAPLTGCFDSVCTAREFVGGSYSRITFPADMYPGVTSTDFAIQMGEHNVLCAEFVNDSAFAVGENISTGWNGIVYNRVLITCPLGEECTIE